MTNSSQTFHAYRDHHEDEDLESCVRDIVTKVMTLAWNADITRTAFLAMDRDALIAFRTEHGISREEMNLAWVELMRVASGSHTSLNASHVAQIHGDLQS